MAAPAWGGTAGTVSFTTGAYWVYNVTRWTLTENNEVLDVTVLTGSLAWRTFIPGIKNWSGSFEGYASNETSGSLDNTGEAAASATFTTGGGDTFAGSIIIQSAEWETGIDAPDTLRCTFQGSGALTKAGA